MSTYTAEKGNVICTKGLNLRKGAPNTSSAIVKTYPAGTKLAYVGYVTDGQSIGGNSKWYKDANGNYFWSGVVKPAPSETPKPIPAEATVTAAAVAAVAGNSGELSAAVGSGCPNKKSDVLLVQNLLKKKGVSVGVDGAFGPNTKSAILSFQKGALGMNGDGRVDVGGKTWKGLNDPAVKYTAPKVGASGFDEKYKDITIQGSVFPDKPISTGLKITLRSEMVNEYLPALEKAMAGQPKGFKYLCTIMAHKEGFYKGTRSYKTNNPGNIGNTDSGRNRSNSTLEDGILLQRDYIKSIIDGKHSAYPMGKKKVIKPYYSPEIAKNSKLYGMSPYVPGYEFVFTGQLDQFVKIYSTGARAGNSYLSTIISYFKSKGLIINAQSKIQDVIKMK